MEPCIPVVLSALYLRGAPRTFDCKRSLWPHVVHVLRTSPGDLPAASGILRDAGLWPEALALETPGLLSWAETQWSQGRTITAEDEGYPWSGQSGPPAVWVRGTVPARPFLAIVGSRAVGPEHRSFARACGREAARLGLAVVSGGAAGCDREAVGGAGASCALEILPCGLGIAPSRSGVCQISVCAPEEPFSTGTAMERNALLYSVGRAALIVHARLRAGGTWHGAIDAHRRKLTRLLVKHEPANAAHRALEALGAVPVFSPNGLADAFAAEAAQPQLVG